MNIRENIFEEHTFSFLQWKFNQLDSDNDDVVVNRELEALNGLFLRESCLYDVLSSCEQRKESFITRDEWRKCFMKARDYRYRKWRSYIRSAFHFFSIVSKSNCECVHGSRVYFYRGRQSDYDLLRYFGYL